MRRTSLVARSYRRQSYRGLSLVKVIRPAYWTLGQPPPALVASRRGSPGPLFRFLELNDLRTPSRAPSASWVPPCPPWPSEDGVVRWNALECAW